nr:MAG TPA: hypothetical protein [Caudoviricetes sp.]
MSSKSSEPACSPRRSLRMRANPSCAGSRTAYPIG